MKTLEQENLELKSQLNSIENLLSTVVTESKDFNQGSILEKIDWLIFFRSHYKEQLEELENEKYESMLRG